MSVNQPSTGGPPVRKRTTSLLADHLFVGGPPVRKRKPRSSADRQSVSGPPVRKRTTRALTYNVSTGEQSDAHTGTVVNKVAPGWEQS